MIKELFFSVIYKFLGPLLGFSLMLAITRYMGVTVYGHYSYLMQLAILICVTGTGGVEKLLYKNVSQVATDSPQPHYNDIFSVNCIRLIMVLLLFFLVSELFFYDTIYAPDSFRFTHLAGLVSGYYLSMFFSSVLISLDRLRLAIAIQSTIYPAILLLAVMLGIDVAYFYDVLVASILFSALISSLAVRKLGLTISPSPARLFDKQRNHQQFNLHKVQVYEIVTTNFDIIIAGFFLASDELGIYSILSRIAVLPLYILQVVEGYFMPKTGKRPVELSFVSARELVIYMAPISLAMLVMLYVTSTQLVPLLIDSDLDLSLVFILLLSSHVISLLIAPFASIGLMLDQSAKAIVRIYTSTLFMIFITLPIGTKLALLLNYNAFYTIPIVFAFFIVSSKILVLRQCLKLH